MRTVFSWLVRIRLKCCSALAHLFQRFTFAALICALFAVITAKPRRARTLRHEVVTAFDARARCSFSVFPNLLPVFGVPLQTFFGRVPCFGQRPCVFRHLPCTFCVFGSPVRSTVLFVRQTLQIGNVVVERIPVFMVDVVTFRDRSVVMFPNRLVQSTNAFVLALGADEVIAQFELRRVRVATIRDSVEYDTFGGFLKRLVGFGQASIMPNAT